MTATTISTRRRLTPRMRLYAALAGLAAILGAAAAFFLAGPGPVASAQTVRVAPARAAALVAATSASATQMRAFGAQAEIINAALPFSSAPVQPSRPFEISGDALDHRRALLCLTQAVYYEAGFEPIDGRRAVAQVVLNRMRHPAFPKSVCGVVYQGAGSPVCQFSFVCDGSLYRAPARASWKEAEGVARAALAGFVENSVGAATHYHADYVAPRWAPMLTKISKLGAHIFYRWPGAWGQRGAFTGRYIGEPSDPASLRPAAPVEDLATGEVVVAEAVGPIVDGTILKRAPNDVGGLLDTSKGWTLKIPDPAETSNASKKALAEQAASAAASHVATAATAAPVVASR